MLLTNGDSRTTNPTSKHGDNKTINPINNGGSKIINSGDNRITNNSGDNRITSSSGASSRILSNSGDSKTTKAISNGDSSQIILTSHNRDRIQATSKLPQDGENLAGVQDQDGKKNGDLSIQKISSISNI